MDNIKRKLNKCRFHSLFIKYSIRKCRKSQLENKIILFALWKVFQYFNDCALLEICKIALYVSVVPSFAVQPMFGQNSGNLPIVCLAHPFSVVSGETRLFLHGLKAVRIRLTRLLRHFQKRGIECSELYHYFLFLYENIGFSRWKETETSKYMRTRLLSQLRRLH